MTPDLLVCPACRQMVDGRLDLHSLERTGDVLACQCGRRYPVIDGVAVVVKDPAFLRSSIVGLVERDLPIDVASLLAEPGPDEAAYPHLLEHLSVYLDAHWGDRAEPPVELAMAPFVERIARLPRVAAAVELGCSAGRVLAEVPAELVIGIDTMFGALRRARHVLAGERVAYARREVGRHYTSATIAPRASKSCTLLCADALDPPLVPEAYDRVIALNLLDSVAQPRQLLAVIDGLCRPGGEIIVSSPYTWRSSVVAEGEQLFGSDPARGLVEHLRPRFAIEEEAEIAWTLRRDARSTVGYRAHYIRARKGT